ncbi:MAG TPA: hypothetical protein VGA36_02180, partial [Nitriliruptorales bacterium]
IEVCRATRVHPDVELGASPRASLGMLRATRAWAAASDRDYVIPDDAKVLAPHVLPHRLILRPEAELSGRTAEHIIDDVLASVPTPTE